MATGRIDLTRTSGSSYLTFWAEWSTSGNGTVANTSTATVWVYAYKSPSSTAATYGSANTSVTLQGVTQAENGLSFRVNPGASVLLFAKTFSIKHNNDGSVSAPISISVGGNVMSASGSGTITPDRIPRQATLINVPASFTDDDSPTITFSNPAGNAVDKLEVCISSDGYAIEAAYREVTKTSTSYTFELTAAEKNALYNVTLDGSTTRKVFFYIRTTIGGLGYVDYRESTFEVSDCKPTINPTVIDVGIVSTELTNDPTKLIKGYNYVEATANFATYKGASIVKQSITCDGRSVENGFATFENVSSGIFVFSVTDNRGQTVSTTVTKEMVDYIRLSCYMSVSPPDADGDLESYIEGNYFDGSFGAVQNELKLEWRYKVNDGEYNDWTPIVPELSDGTYRATITMSGLDYQSFYTFQARAADKPYYDYIETIEYKVKTTPVFDWGENDFNFNVPVSIKGVEVDYIVEQGEQDGWFYRKWNGGVAECWKIYYGSAINAAANNYSGFYYSGTITVPFPFTFTNLPTVEVSGGSTDYMNFVRTFGLYSDKAAFAVVGLSNVTSTDITVHINAIGRWK